MHDPRQKGALMGAVEGEGTPLLPCVTTADAGQAIQHDFGPLHGQIPAKEQKGKGLAHVLWRSRREARGTESTSQQHRGPACLHTGFLHRLARWAA